MFFFHDILPVLHKKTLHEHEVESVTFVLQTIECFNYTSRLISPTTAYYFRVREFYAH